MSNETHEKKTNEKYKKIFWAVVSPLLAVITVWILFRQNEDVSLKDILQTAAGSDKRWFAAALVSSIVYIVAEGMALCAILREAGCPKTVRHGILYSTADIYFSAITPSATGGQPASAYFMMRSGISGGVTTAVLLLNLMMYTLSIVALGVLAVIICPGALTGFNLPAKLLIAAGTITQLALAVFFMAILRNGNFIFDLLERAIAFFGRKRLLRHPKKKIAKLAKARRDYDACSEMFAGNKVMLLKVFLWNLLQRFSQIVVPALLYISLGAGTADAVRLFSKQCLITIGYNFVPLPGAMGVADYLMLHGFSDLMGRDTAFHLEMLSRSLTFYICVSVSGLITFIGYILFKRRRRFHAMHQEDKGTAV